MPDQLSLRLDPTVPRLPETIRPMTALPAAAPFDSPDHLFEPTWGGVRALAFIETRPGDLQPTLRVVDDVGRELTSFVPELQSLAGRLDGATVVFDGELVVVNRTGRGDRLALANRLRGKPGAPVAYLAFDLLYVDGRPLFGQPLTRRRDLLRRTLRAGDDALAVPAIVGEGRALYEATVQAGIGGVMGRERRSPYLPGVRSRLWRYVAPGDVTANVDDATGAADAVGGATTNGDEAEAASGAPVLSLIRRLPLPFDEDD
jgi:bifunctional non-homologous end joining protein LigD